jgi:hypothetical protein
VRIRRVSLEKQVCTVAVVALPESIQAGYRPREKPASEGPMAQHKAAVPPDEMKQIKLPDVVALHAKVQTGAGTEADRELLTRLIDRWRGRYRDGRLSEKTARQLGIV